MAEKLRDLYKREFQPSLGRCQLTVYLSKGGCLEQDALKSEQSSPVVLFKDAAVEVLNGAPAVELLVIEARVIAEGKLALALSVAAFGLFSFELLLQGRALPGRILLEVLNNKDLPSLSGEELASSNGFQTKSTFKFTGPSSTSATKRELALGESAKTEKLPEKRKLKPILREPSHGVLQKGSKVARFNSNQIKRLSLPAEATQLDARLAQLKKVMNKKPGLLDSFLKGGLVAKGPQDFNPTQKSEKDRKP